MVAAAADIAGQHHRRLSVSRLGIGALPFLLPLLMQVGFGLSPFNRALVTFALRRRRHGHEGRWRRRIIRTFGFRNIMVGQCGRELGFSRRLRAVHGVRPPLLVES